MAERKPRPIPRADPRTDAAEPRDTTSVWSRLKDESVKVVIAGLLSAAGGYAAALIITPEQLYRRLFLPDFDNYVGTWTGRLGSRYAELRIAGQQQNPDGRTSNVFGSLVLGMGRYQRRIPVRGGADSLVTLAGPWDAAHEITISLDRSLGEIKKPGERFVRLLPQKGESGAAICDVSNDLLRMPNAEDCRAVPGTTYFTF